jgi:hypothetical protein
VSAHTNHTLAGSACMLEVYVCQYRCRFSAAHQHMPPTHTAEPEQYRCTDSTRTFIHKNVHLQERLSTSTFIHKYVHP